MPNKYLISSKDSFFAREKIFQIASKHEIPEPKIFVEPTEFIEEVYQGDLFDDSRKLIALLPLTTEGLPEILNICNLDISDVIVLVDYGGLSKNRNYTKIKTCCEIVTIKKFSDKEAVLWTGAALKKQGFSYEPGVPELLVSYKGADAYAIYNELKKLDIFSTDKKITKKICKEIVLRVGEGRMFDFSEHFFRKHKRETIEEFNTFSENSYIGLIHLLLSQCDRFYKVACYREQKMSNDIISEMMGVPKFIVKTKMFTVLNVFNKVKLLKLMDMLNDLDKHMRLSRFNKRLLFEGFLLKAFNI
jgi:DNA polymerase III delta subunit